MIENESTIIVRIFGGLGNQMFQYAAAKSLALNNGATLKLDISSFDQQISSETPRQYALGIFTNITDEFSEAAFKNSVVPPLRNYLFNKVYKFAVQKINWLNRNFIIENSYSYSPVKYNGGLVYIDGYWQSYKYFKANEKLIRIYFDLSYLANEITIEPIINSIRNSVAVSLHVRRGDYVTNVKAKNYVRLYDLAFYKKAIEKIREMESGKMKIFIFSDDAEWCKKNMKFKEEHTFINTGSDSHDLYLMSICKHNIIANSTFSWWAAWLNNNTNKIVVAPQKWYQGSKNSNDLLPAEWIRFD